MTAVTTETCIDHVVEWSDTHPSTDLQPGVPGAVARTVPRAAVLLIALAAVAGADGIGENDPSVYSVGNCLVSPTVDYSTNNDEVGWSLMCVDGSDFLVSLPEDLSRAVDEFLLRTNESPT